jgi:hypothetical protein
MHGPPELWDKIGVWVAALLTLGVYSFLYRDNPLYKFVEHLFVGVSAGYGIGIAWQFSIVQLIWDPLVKHDPDAMMGLSYPVVVAITVPPTILGLMFFLRFVPSLAWLARWPLAFVVGVGAGSAIPSVVQATLIKQLQGTMLPAVAAAAGKLDPLTSVNNVILILGVFCVLSYFYFSREHKGVLGLSSRLGIWFLMVAFGAGFGNTVMARISLLIGRAHFLLSDWLGLVK